MFIVNTFILIISIIYWVNSGNFNQKLFWVGLIGSIFDTIGKVTSLSALNYGPGGPSTALVCLAGPYLVVIVAILT